MAHGVFQIPRPENEAVLAYEPASAAKKLLKAELARQSQNPREIPLVIGGKALYDRPKVELRCPHQHGAILARVAQATPQDCAAAIDAALAAKNSWANLAWEERAAIFLKAASLISGKYRQKITAATMLGQSKTCYQAEIEAACELADFLRFNAYYAQKIYEDQPLVSPAGQWNRSVARPLEGFVYAVAPFNFTAISLNLACAPALMGNTVLWKPAPTAVLASYLGLEILQEAGLPAGVINMIQGEPESLSAVALKHPLLSGIHFTGSTQVFQHLWTAVGKNISHYRTYPRLVGETGGKDFVFAHPSADCDQLVIALLRGAFEYQGQKCSAASRAYIPQSLWPEVKKKLVTETQALKMGDPADFSNFMAAVIDAKAFTKIQAFIEHARGAADATIICGGECDQSKGYFVRPTIIETSNPHYKSMVEEIFGPVLTVYPYEDSQLAEAVGLCESTSAYALTGAIFARDREAIAQLSAKLANAAGNFYINDKPTGAVVGQQPFGGARASGTNDKAGSLLNLQRWVSPRVIKENFLPFATHRYPHMEEA